MSRPFKKPESPKPSSRVVVRRIGQVSANEVVTLAELARRKEAKHRRQWLERALARNLTVFEENARLRLSRGALLLVPDYTDGLWWYVTDVNYPDRTITAATLMFEQLREVTFPFAAVELHTLWTIAEQNEAGVAWRQVSAELSARTLPLRSAA